MIVAAYLAIPGGYMNDEYAAELACVEQRAKEAEVFVALSGDSVTGCVTLAPDSSSPLAELLEPGEAGVRMLAVLPSAQGHGVGEALVEACISRARELGRLALVLHTTPWMKAAQRLYEKVGFERLPERDWASIPEVPLLAYRLLL